MTWRQWKMSDKQIEKIFFFQLKKKKTFPNRKDEWSFDNTYSKNGHVQNGVQWPFVYRYSSTFGTVRRKVVDTPPTGERRCVTGAVSMEMDWDLHALAVDWPSLKGVLRGRFSRTPNKEKKLRRQEGVTSWGPYWGIPVFPVWSDTDQQWPRSTREHRLGGGVHGSVQQLMWQ